MEVEEEEDKYQLLGRDGRRNIAEVSSSADRIIQLE